MDHTKKGCSSRTCTCMQIHNINLPYTRRHKSLPPLVTPRLLTPIANPPPPPPNNQKTTTPSDLFGSFCIFKGNGKCHSNENPGIALKDVHERHVKGKGRLILQDAQP